QRPLPHADSKTIRLPGEGGSGGAGGAKASTQGICRQVVQRHDPTLSRVAEVKEGQEAEDFTRAERSGGEVSQGCDAGEDLGMTFALTRFGTVIERHSTRLACAVAAVER